MTDSGATAEVKAKVEVRPARSQVFLVAITIVAAIAVICAAGLFAIKMDIGWLFIILALLILGGGFWSWMRSQSDSDLDKAHPTHIELPDVLTITTDSRTLRSPEGISGLVTVLQEALLRQPLPDPEGLLDTNAQIIPNSKNEAIDRVHKINIDTQITTDSLIDMFDLSGKSTHVTQEISCKTDSPCRVQ